MTRLLRLIGRAVCAVIGVHRVTQSPQWQHGEFRGYLDRCERCGREWEVRR